MNQAGIFKSKGIIIITFLAAIALIICTSSASGANAVLKNKKKGPGGLIRADVIKIDILSIYGDLEQPPVLFLHDLHTKTLEKEEKNCSLCHLDDKHYLSIKFMRLKNSGKNIIKTLFHDNCQKCHQEMAASQKKAGPVDCKGCHSEKPSIIRSIHPFDFDKSLHFRHTKRNKNRCDFCHHKYDESSKTLYFYKKKYIVRRMPEKKAWTSFISDGTCRYCHGQTKDINRLSMKDVSHITCIECHRKSDKAKKSAGPVDCSGCHDEKKIKLIKKEENVPRRNLKQPDTTIVSLNTQDEEIKNRLNLVPFNHKSHEEYNDTCRVCHHARLNKCSSCHTLSGSEDGNNVALQQAMHQAETKRSCIGCHKMMAGDKSCAGCHAFGDKHQSQKISSCHSCHRTQLPVNAKPEDQDQRQQVKEKITTAFLLDSGKPVASPLKGKSIPSKVVIKHLTEKYGPVEFPHLQIVKKIAENIKNNKIANYFHTETTTLCQGCHHHSPGSTTPPDCRNCHGRPFDERSPIRPGIKGAYHKRCMGCHDEMEIKSPNGCTECHKEKIKQP